MWIAMELVRGTSLRDLVEQSGPVSLARFVPFFERLCEVMQAAHEQGIIHRDIKPHNVMVLNRAARMFPKLLDLGIARGQGQPIDVSEAPSRIADSDSVELTLDGEVVGTPHYMAPEQWLDPAAADARSDLQLDPARLSRAQGTQAVRRLRCSLPVNVVRCFAVWKPWTVLAAGAAVALIRHAAHARHARECPNGCVASKVPPTATSAYNRGRGENDAAVVLVITRGVVAASGRGVADFESAAR